MGHLARLRDAHDAGTNYLHEMGFTSEVERFGMILGAMAKDADATWDWMEQDGTAEGLRAILNRKQRVRRETENG